MFAGLDVQVPDPVEFCVSRKITNKHMKRFLPNSFNSFIAYFVMSRSVQLAALSTA